MDHSSQHQQMAVCKYSKASCAHSMGYTAQYGRRRAKTSQVGRRQWFPLLFPSMVGGGDGMLVTADVSACSCQSSWLYAGTVCGTSCSKLCPAAAAAPECKKHCCVRVCLRAGACGQLVIQHSQAAGGCSSEAAAGGVRDIEDLTARAAAS